MREQVEPVLQLEEVVEIAKSHNTIPAQVLIHHALQGDIIIIAKSVKTEQITTNYHAMLAKIALFVDS